ncbi:DMP19 family protein [Planctomicrobium sp. SH668]|uniref:DMP19 family protein n=1 Tax=Planctomicrobium sp. SH668 TaxID=3448126 RepID=UPI003F5BDE9D
MNGSAPPDFPPGLKQLLPIINMDLAIQGGGLWGYFGDVTNDDGTFSEVNEVIEYLRTIKADRIRSVLEEACEVWKEFVAVYLPARCRVVKKSFEEFQYSKKFREDMERQLDPLDDEYFAAGEELQVKIGEYARSNPQAFIHPVVNQD